MKISKEMIVEKIIVGDKTQRLRGLILELYFQKTVSPYLMNLTGALFCSFGWLKGWVERKVCFVKILAVDKVGPADVAFTKRMREQGALVIFLSPDVSNDTLLGYSLLYSQKYSETEARIGRDIATRSSVYLKENIYVRNSPGDTKRYLLMLGVEELLEIFNSRVVMNSGAIIGVTDLDAVYLMHDSQLVVVEFKRKYPAVKYRPLFLPVTSSRGLGGLVYKLKKSHSTVCQSTYVLSRCFGLDLSHVKNFIYLNSAKVKYVYMILNRVRKEPSELIDFSFKNYGSGLINFKEVEYSDFVGVCETDGEHSETEGEQRAESGSWDDGLRYQLTILESSFFRGFDVGRVQR